MADFDTCKTALLLSEPFFGSLLMKVPHRAVDDFPFLAGVSKSALVYNPAQWAKLTDEEGIFVLAHEIMHMVYDHLTHLEAYNASGIGPDGKPFNNRKMNMAEDYVVNDTLIQAKVGTMPTGKFKGLWDAKYPNTMTPAEIYCLLKDPPCEACGFDQHQITDETAAISREDIVQAANIAKASRGTIPDSVQRLLDDIRKPPTNPWARLRKAVLDGLHGRDSSSWKRLHRRLIVRDIGAPGPIGTARAGRIGIVGDTSGSIDAAMLNLFGSHMAAIMEEAQPRDTIVYWVDAQLHDQCTVKNGTQLRAYLRKGAKGGGGTDMTVGVRAAAKDKCDICVVLTDGYTPFGEPRDAGKMRMIWAITTPGCKAEWGETIHIAGATA